MNAATGFLRPCRRRGASRLRLAAVTAGLAALASLSCQAQGADRGERVTVVLSEEPDTLDGCNANSSATGRVIRNNVVEGLAEIDPKDGSLLPRGWTPGRKSSAATTRTECLTS